MKYYLGIDGGGTKTQYLISDEKLNIIAEYIGPTCHYMQCGYPELSRLLKEGILKVCNQAQISPEDITSAFIGCAGYGDTEGDKAPIEEAVRLGMCGIKFAIGNDCENALAGALGGADGINIIAGTGSMACGKVNGSDAIRCGGWHHALRSDEGSAYWISIKLLQEFTKQSDGRHERTSLYNAVKNRLQLEDDGDVITLVVTDWDLDRGKIASLSPLCTELYDAGEPCAIAIVKEAASELADLAISIDRLLGHPENMTVSGTGGVFKMGDRLIQPLSKKLSEHNLTFKEPLYSPGQGSLILARNIDK